MGYLGMKDSRNFYEIEQLLQEVLNLLGEDINRPGLARTPELWAKALLESTAGLAVDPSDYLTASAEFGNDQEKVVGDMVIVDNIAFISTCEHHMKPVHGRVHIGYMLNATTTKVVGFSRLIKVVEALTHRLQLQERLTQEIAQIIDGVLKPTGVIVVVHAWHDCMIQTGSAEMKSSVITTARRGLFAQRTDLEATFNKYLQLQIYPIGHEK